MQCLIMSCDDHLLMLLCHISTALVFSKWLSQLLPRYAKTTKWGAFSKKFFLFLLPNSSNRNKSLSKCHLPTVENTLFGGNVEISNRDRSQTISVVCGPKSISAAQGVLVQGRAAQWSRDMWIGVRAFKEAESTEFGERLDTGWEKGRIQKWLF